ncbi:MAG: glycosyltransferase [Myxococcota bacterium]
MIDLSVVIPCYENAALLARCLDGLARARAAHPELAFEVVVVDNGSREPVVETARASSLAPRVVALARNRGFAAAVDFGLRLRRGRHVLLLNSDAVVEPDALARGLAHLDAEADLGVVGARLRHGDGRPQRSAHAFPGLASALLSDRLVRGWHAIARARPFGASGAGDALRDVPAVRGAVFFVRGDVLDAIGDFDASYFFFLEETDYCWRVRAAGLRVAEAGDVRATHALGASSKARAPLATRIEFERSLDRFLRRHRGRATAGLVRALRTLRTALGATLLLLPAVASRRARRRGRERAGLLLWHLRGRPDEPVLAEALAAGSGRAA